MGVSHCVEYEEEKTDDAETTHRPLELVIGLTLALLPSLGFGLPYAVPPPVGYAPKVVAAYALSALASCAYTPPPEEKVAFGVGVTGLKYDASPSLGVPYANPPCAPLSYPYALSYPYVGECESYGDGECESCTNSDAG
jgi:hypothetical protein